MEAQWRCLSKMTTLISHALIIACVATAAAASPALLLQPGFSASPHSSYADFQPLLADPTGVFAFGFLQPSSTDLDLAVVHLPSSLPIWRAIPAQPAVWSESASLSFNGSLVFYDSDGGVLWSTTAAGGGDTVVLLNTSNLQILQHSQVVWQSFDFPADTLMQGQNFTSASTVVSTNQQFSMRLGAGYVGLFLEFGGGDNSTAPPMYWKHWALKYKAVGRPPLSLMVTTDGFLGLFQGADTRVDLIPFDSFGRGLTALQRLTMDSDGNLRAYYWNDSTNWVTEFTAITDACGLPTACGAYGLCSEGAVTSVARCQCLESSADVCPAAATGDFCGKGGDGYSVFRRKGVDLPNKELVPFEVVGSVDECEAACERNCTCWGAVYNNITGYCYQVDYPIQTMLLVNELKVGYFKVRNSGGGGGGGRKAKVALLVVGLMIVAGVAAVAAYRFWNWKRMGGADGLSPGPYTELLRSVSSIELPSPFRRK